MANLNPNILIITLNGNGLSLSNQKTEVDKADIKKHNPTICYLPDTHFKHDNIGRLKVKGWKMIHQANINFFLKKHGWIYINKVDFREKITRDKEKYYI